ncbi:phospholipase D-like domain-containing protein [soil metagenome]
MDVEIVPSSEGRTSVGAVPHGTYESAVNATACAQGGVLMPASCNTNRVARRLAVMSLDRRRALRSHLRMQNVIAFANNDVITIAWTFGRKLTGCLGFAVYRIDQKGRETPLPAFAVFKGMSRQRGQTCVDAPIQKFYWKDVYARVVADRTGNRRFRYKIVPLSGKPRSLVPMHIPFVVSNEVEISPTVSQGVKAYFNRGLISTQRVSRAFKGKPAKGPLLERVADEHDALRTSLSGDMLGALTGFVARAAKSGQIYAALYELHDAQLVTALVGIGKRLNVVLSNSMKVDPATKEKLDDNEEARAALEASAGKVWNRILPNSQIGHNKFLVYVDGQGKPVAALFGSTNWTSTGLCTQTNNTLVIDDPGVAGRLLKCWKQLAADTKQADGEPKALQSAKLRQFDAASARLQLADGSQLTSWLSPNTPKLRSTSKAKETPPPDMAEVIELVKGAEDAVLFLVFYPGTPSVANWAAAAQKSNPKLFVRGCVTNPSAAESFYYELHGGGPPPTEKGVKRPPGKQDDRVIAAAALGREVPAGWAKEILNAGFAITHDKIIVIDPFSKNCAVVTGSHNLGYKASFNNDENLAIIRGNRRLAEAYASHVLDVYDHFAWRRMVETRGQKQADQSLTTDPDAWQAKYFDNQGNIQVAQLQFWLSALS